MPATTARRLFSFVVHAAPIMTMALDEPNQWVFTGDTKGVVSAWNLKLAVESGKLERLFETKELASVYHIALGRQGKTEVLWAGGAFPRLSVYDRKTGAPKTHLTLPNLTPPIRDLEVVPERGWLYVLTQSGQLGAFEIGSNRRLFAEASGIPGAYALCARSDVPPNTAVVAVGGIDGSLTLFQHEPAGLSRIRRYALGELITYDVAFVGVGTLASAGNSALVAAASNGHLFRQGELDPSPVVMGKDKGQMFALAVTPDGRRVVTGGEAPHVTCRDLTTGNELARMPVGAPVWAVAMTADGRVAVVSDATGRVYGFALPE